MRRDASPANRLAEALAVIVIDLVAAISIEDRTATLEGLASRFDDRGAMPNGSEAARLIGATGSALMRLGY